ncbi:UNVERIFIED_CONTAM: hypothetical protein PYX00_009591 [Menopon gallinae]|uniref:Potassium channel domain-containing protein n=1 Tax=Menopon gallinae TaxID=328185 RepID=A0AAW2HBW4_9NEOP
MEKTHYPPYDTFQKTPQPAKPAKKKEKNKCIHNTAYYLQILFSNIGICALLIGYTFLGSFIFLMIEGKASVDPRQALTDRQSGFKGKVNRTGSAEWRQSTEEFRSKTVENIWEITAALNILYRENWTRLAGQEINRFQDELVQKLTEEILNSRSEIPDRQFQMEWNFSRAFLYSLTILTTIGYGGFSPKTFLGKIITIVYAVIGIPLMLLYLSSVGSVLSRCARGVCSRALCCCLCSNCGYCCYDEKRMEEKERRMRRKRELEELQQRQLQEPFYVRSSSSISEFTATANTASTLSESKDYEEDWNVKSTGSILAPLGLCLMIMLTYIITGAILLIKLESWPFLDCCYFCFMSLSTINLTDIIILKNNIKNTTIWLCSMYILTGLALTAMCFNILHEELLKRLKKQLMNGLSSRKEPAVKKNPNLADETGPDLYSTS